jgi:hypothetical protein
VTAPRRIIAIAATVAATALAILLMLNAPGGPSEDKSGIIETYSFHPNDSGPPTQLATVRLSDGATVLAQVRPGVLVQPGYAARVRVYHRIITGTATYQLYASESPH